MSAIMQSMESVRIVNGTSTLHIRAKRLRLLTQNMQAIAKLSA